MKPWSNVRFLRPIFVIYKRPETPSFCIVAHVLALAFDNDASLSFVVQNLEDIWVTEIDDYRYGTPLEWK
jgi:hypothetical protein